MRFNHWNALFPEPGTFRVGDRLLPDFISRILISRGIKDSEAAAHFLACDEPLHDPMLLRDMEKAVDLIQNGIDTGKRFLIFGDYDCDGITATVLLYDYLENAGADVCYYIPERLSEGYGLNMEAVDTIKQAGIDIVITVDNGISSLEEIKYANSLGIKTVITDHHTVPEELPPAEAVINPHREDSEYPYRELCGAAVAFKLIAALEQANQGGEDVQELLLDQYGDLLVIGVLADVVPLTGENRILARRGLSALSTTYRPGLLALAEVGKIDLSGRSSDVVSYGIAPRINVTGRIGSVDDAVELLLSGDGEKAMSLARKLNELNQKRRVIEEGITDDILSMISKHPKLLRGRLLAVVGEDWHIGIIGITASRMVERFQKPAVIISCKDGLARGSCRSVEGFSIIGAITSCRDLLIKFGGHPMAAGFTLAEENLPLFLEGLEQYAAEHHPVMPRYSVRVDAPIEPRELTLPNVESLLELEPFGAENPQPVFLIKNAELLSVSSIGNGQHIRFSCRVEHMTVPFVYFWMSQKEFPFAPGERLDIACTLSVNTYNERRRISVKVVGVHPAGFCQEEFFRDRENFDALLRGEARGEGIPLYGREDLAPVFRFLREVSPCHAGRDGFYHMFKKKYPGAQYFKVLASLQIMQELGLAVMDDEEVITLRETGHKVNLPDSETFLRMQADR